MLFEAFGLLRKPILKFASYAAATWHKARKCVLLDIRNGVAINQIDGLGIVIFGIYLRNLI